MCHRMIAALPPPRVLDAAGLRPEDLSSMPGTERAWLAETPDGRVVIRDVGDERDTAWLYRALDALDTSFPAPRPVCLFGDESTFSFGSRTWDAFTFPPGRPGRLRPASDARGDRGVSRSLPPGQPERGRWYRPSARRGQACPTGQPGRLGGRHLRDGRLGDQGPSGEGDSRRLCQRPRRGRL